MDGPPQDIRNFYSTWYSSEYYKKIEDSPQSIICNETSNGAAKNENPFFQFGSYPDNENKETITQSDYNKTQPNEYTFIQQKFPMVMALTAFSNVFPFELGLKQGGNKSTTNPNNDSHNPIGEYGSQQNYVPVKNDKANLLAEPPHKVTPANAHAAGLSTNTKVTVIPSSSGFISNTRDMDILLANGVKSNEVILEKEQKPTIQDKKAQRAKFMQNSGFTRDNGYFTQHKSANNKLSSYDSVVRRGQEYDLYGKVKVPCKMNPQMKDAIPHAHEVEKREFVTELIQSYPRYEYPKDEKIYTTQNTLKDTGFSVHNKFQYTQSIQTELQELVRAHPALLKKHLLQRKGLYSQRPNERISK